MRVLVVGSAAHLDLILRAERIPAHSDFALLDDTPSSSGDWMQGGAAMTIAVALVRWGLGARLWHPMPSMGQGDLDIADIAREGVETTACPTYDGRPVRSVIVHGPDWRLGWSRPPVAVRIDDPDALLTDIDHVVIAPVWGPWTETVLERAQVRGIPASLVGFADPRAGDWRWDTVVLDREQTDTIPNLSARERVVTDGPRGATVTAGDTTTTIPANPATPVDPTGAGDSFAGSYLALRLAGRPVDRAGQCAAAYAARTITEWGSRPPAEFYADILRQNHD